MSKIDIETTNKKMILFDDDSISEENNFQKSDDYIINEDDDGDLYDLETLEQLKTLMKEHINELSLPLGEYISINKIQKCILTLLKYN